MSFIKVVECGIRSCRHPSCGDMVVNYLWESKTPIFLGSAQIISVRTDTLLQYVTHAGRTSEMVRVDVLKITTGGGKTLTVLGGEETQKYLGIHNSLVPDIKSPVSSEYRDYYDTVEDLQGNRLPKIE